MRDLTVFTTHGHKMAAAGARGVGVLGVVLALLVAPVRASAQEPAAEPVSDGGSSGGADREAPDTMWVGGGFSMLANSGVLPGMRAEFGLPISDRFPLSLVFPFTFHGRSESFFGATIKSRVLTILPAVQYEFVLPIDMSGMVTIVGELGLGFSLVRVKGSGLGGSDTRAGAGLHAAAFARYYFGSVPNLFLSLQPVGVTAVLNSNSRAFYEFLVGAGYRF